MRAVAPIKSYYIETNARKFLSCEPAFIWIVMNHRTSELPYRRQSPVRRAIIDRFIVIKVPGCSRSCSASARFQCKNICSNSLINPIVEI